MLAFINSKTVKMPNKCIEKLIFKDICVCVLRHRRARALYSEQLVATILSFSIIIMYTIHK